MDDAAKYNRHIGWNLTSWLTAAVAFIFCFLGAESFSFHQLEAQLVGSCPVGTFSNVLVQTGWSVPNGGNFLDNHSLTSSACLGCNISFLVIVFSPNCTHSASFCHLALFIADPLIVTCSIYGTDSVLSFFEISSTKKKKMVYYS